MVRLMRSRAFWAGVAAVHYYLSAGHLVAFFGGEITWTHGWKGFGALAGAVFMTWVSLGRRSKT